MAEDGSGVGVAGHGDDDAVSAARQWLARQGLPVPERDSVGSAGVPEAEESAGAGRGDLAQSQPVPESQRGAGSRRRSREPSGSDDADADPVAVARGIVLRKLAAQARTRHELTKALAVRDVSEEVARDVLDRFQEVGLVDDVTFAHDWVESRQQRRHLSSSALRRELQTKGVDRDTIDAAVAQVDGDDELVAARALAEKKLRSVSGLPREVQYRRLAGALARRGFSGGVTAAVIGPLLDGRED
ncbi:regulatory protein RecX [uncultured Friedmanniella sp.]|uniref:regulatory protein RecX n=1 Tax=uncultured Friedmanniella sp. TaxID=335381 RepID=UPI0035CC1786